MSSSIAVHWAIADKLGEGISLSSQGLSDGCRTNTEFEDWTWRSWYVWSSVHSTAFGLGCLESMLALGDSADFSHKLSDMSAEF